MSMRLGDTPVPIPNTMVKTQAADGTLLETVRESRWMPGSWGYSSVGRAPALQAGGHEFESRYLHESFLKAQTKDWNSCQACLKQMGQDGGCICKMHVNEKIFDFRVPRSALKSLSKKSEMTHMYLENCILKMIRHQTVNNQISYL